MLQSECISFHKGFLSFGLSAVRGRTHPFFARVIQELVSQVEKTKNVVDATNQPNLYERLEAIQGSLALCEKALAEYLETKRLAFPRFYFVSSSDLLDILSNGNNPVSVSLQQQQNIKVFRCE